MTEAISSPPISGIALSVTGRSVWLSSDIATQCPLHSRNEVPGMTILWVEPT